MIVGILKEIKAEDNRVAMSPGGVEVMRQNGHSVLVEKNAGRASGFNDKAYENAGAEIVKGSGEIFDRAKMILRVKEPQPSESGYLKK
ncbi:MAG: alanine dehydrogenase, partial [Desulfobacterales bacterium]